MLLLLFDLKEYSTSYLKVFVALLILTVITLVSAFTKPSSFEFCFRVSIYFIAAVLLLNTQKEIILSFPYPPQMFHRVFWGSIAFSVIIYHLMTRFSTLKDTTLDYIVLFIVLILPFFPGELIARWNLGTVTGGMLVFLWATDLLLNNEKKRFNLFSVLCFLSVIIMSSRFVLSL